MRFDVEANGHRHVVEAHRAGNLWRITCDGREMTADLRRAGDRWSLLIGPPEGGPYTSGPPEGGPYTSGPPEGEALRAEAGRRPCRSYEVSIESRGRGERIVHLAGQPVPVSLVDSRAALTRRRDPSGDAHDGITSIVATMPGRVVKVLVQAGEPVAARQALVVVEAMKMENEIRSPRAGTVREVRVAAGASIEAGTVMVVIE